METAMKNLRVVHWGGYVVLDAMFDARSFVRGVSAKASSK